MTSPLHLYAAELTCRLQPTAYFHDMLAGLDLQADQARKTWPEPLAAERQSYPATSLGAQ